MKFFYIWLATFNIITFVVFGIDKRKAINGKFRISEAALFCLSLLGGSFGGLAAMYTFHHKTQKWYFRFGIPLIMLFQIAAVWFLLKNYI